jgi:uncharacterized membrane protein (DUF106 family)
MNYDKLIMAFTILLFFSVVIPGGFWLTLSFMFWEILPFSWVLIRLSLLLGVFMMFLFWFTTDEEGRTQCK